MKTSTLLSVHYRKRIQTMAVLCCVSLGCVFLAVGEVMIVDWGGDGEYEVSKIELETSEPILSADGQTKIYPFDTTRPLATSSLRVVAREDKTSIFFGGNYLTSSTGRNLDWTWMRVQGTAPETVRISFDRREREDTAYSGAVFVCFKREHFLNLEEHQRVNFANGGHLEMDLTTDNAAPASYRFAVLSNGQWYLSEKSEQTALRLIIPAEEISFSKWGKWSPDTGEGGRLAPVPNAFEDAEGKDFASIEAVGFYAEFSSSLNTRGFVATKHFQAFATPVPKVSP